MAEKTTAQKITESQAGRKGRQVEDKIEATQDRREARKLTPERKRQKEDAARSLNVRSQQLAGQRTQAERQQAAGEVPSGINVGRGRELLALEAAGQKPDQPLTAEEAKSKRFARNLTSRKTEQKQTGQASAELRAQAASGFGARNVLEDGQLRREAPATTAGFGDQLKREIGSIDPETGPTPEQTKAIAAVEDFNKNFAIQQEQTQAKTEVQLKRGTFTGGTPANQLFGDLEAPGGVLPSDAPDVFKEQIGLAGGVAGAEVDTAFANQEAAESLRERKLRNEISKLSLGEEGDNVLQALEGQLGRLSLPQLEELAGRNGLELTDSLKESLSRDGKSAIEREKITKEDRVAENEYSKRQLARTFDRATTDREEFNLQQDARLRRLAASFGGGKSSTIGSNVAVMKEAEKGQRAADDLKANFADKTMLVSRQADSIIETYGNNVQIIEGQMADAIENKYAEITNTIDDLMDAGITNELELNNAILKAKKDYVKTYTDVSTKAFEAIQKQNKTFFDQQVKLRELRVKEEGDRATNRFTDPSDPNRFTSSQTRNNQTVQDLGAGQPFTRDDGTQGFLGENCVKYARSLVPSLPFGLNTTADKKRAVEQFGFTDREQVKVGDVVLTAEGSVGHAAVITAINEDGTYVLDEANYTPGRVTKGGQINSDDAKILGFISGEGGMSVDTGAFNVGGNVELEGTQAGIEAQMNEPEGIDVFPQDIQSAVFEFEQGSASVKNAILSELRGAEQSRPGITGEFERALTISKQGKQADLQGTPLGEELNRALGLGLGGDEALDFAKKRLEESFGKLTEAQGKAFKAVKTASAEEENYQSVIAGVDQEDFADSINVLTKKITDTEATLTAEIVNRNIKDPQIRRAILSEMRWVAAVLREESGAAISLGEYLSKGGAFFPRAGDDIGTIQDKERARRIEIEGLLGKVGASGQRKLDEQAAARKDRELEDLRQQLQDPTPEQSQEIEQARQDFNLQPGEQLVLRKNDQGELKFAAIFANELLSNDIEL